MGLRLRVILILVIPAVLLVGVHGYLRVRHQEERLLDESRQTLDLTVAAVKIAMENALRHRQEADVRRLLSEMVERQDTIERIRLFDADGGLTLRAGPDGGVEVGAAVVERVVRTGVAEASWDRGVTPPVLTFVIPLRSRSERIDGAMEVAHVARGIERRRAEAVLDVWVRLGILLSALILLIWFALQRQVLRPLALLTEGIQRVGRGQATGPLAVERGDELGGVARAFNQMADDLEQARVRLVAESERALEFEQELARAERLAVAGRLTSALAHEVGTPLNVVSGRAEFLAKSLAVDDPRRHDLEIIVAQIDRITRTIASLLDSVRPHRPHLRPTPVREVVDGILPLLRHAARRQQVAIEASLADDLTVEADAGQLQQVLINLVLNAVDATPTGGTVTVAATPAPRDGRPGVLLTVRDTGSGIPPEVLPRVFEPFFTTKPAGRGTGLGLAICRDIVLAHDGDVVVDSQVGRGTVFSVWLPSPAAVVVA
jgi:signal transduction histidine kinase